MKRWPTVAGWLALLLVVLVAAVFSGRHAYRLLAVNEPVGATLLVVEGWMEPGELAQVATKVRAGWYKQILTSGGPIYDPWHTDGPETFAERAAVFLRGLLPGVSIIAVPAPDAPSDRTYTSALAVREWVAASGMQIDSVDVFSWGPHARRSRDLYRLAFGPAVRIGVFAAEPTFQNFDSWYLTSYATEELLKEVVGVVWVKCCFWP